MQPAEQVQFPGIAPLPELCAAVERHASRLERFHERVAACRVALQRWHERHGQEGSYRVEVDSALPGDERAIARESRDANAHDW